MLAFSASEKQLPSSMRKLESKLVPNSVSASTFEQGLTLHSLLCGGMDKVNLERRTMSQENLMGMGSPTKHFPPPFYRNVSNNSLMMSPPAGRMIANYPADLSPFSPFNMRKPLSEWNQARNADGGGGESAAMAAQQKKKADENIQIGLFPFFILLPDLEEDSSNLL